MLYLIFCLSSALGPLQAQEPSQSSDIQILMDRGVQAFKQARYDEAASAFQRVVELAPSHVNAHLYLGTTYMSRSTPDANMPAVALDAQKAQSEFSRVLALEPSNKTAVASLASLAYSQSRWATDPQEKLRALEDARVWYTQLAAISPDDKSAYYSLGVVAWSKWYPPFMEARRQLGMRPETPGPLPNAGMRQQLLSQYGDLIAEGIANLQKALSLDPDYDDAMAYINLLVREHADLRDTQAEYDRDVQTANDWVRKALDTKKRKQGVLSPSMIPSTPPETPSRIRIGGDVQASKLMRKVDPVYPPLARQARIQGTVRYSVAIGKDGLPISIQLISGHPLLVPAATEAVRQYIYQPTLLNGQPVEVVTQVDVGFSLN